MRAARTSLVLFPLLWLAAPGASADTPFVLSGEVYSVSRTEIMIVPGDGRSIYHVERGALSGPSLEKASRPGGKVSLRVPASRVRVRERTEPPNRAGPLLLRRELRITSD